MNLCAHWIVSSLNLIWILVLLALVFVHHRVSKIVSRIPNELHLVETRNSIKLSETVSNGIKCVYCRLNLACKCLLSVWIHFECNTLNGKHTYNTETTPRETCLLREKRLSCISFLFLVLFASTRAFYPAKREPIHLAEHLLSDENYYLINTYKNRIWSHPSVNILSQMHIAISEQDLFDIL